MYQLKNLLLAGISPKDIFITGNTVVDACVRNLKIAKNKSEMPFKIDREDKILTLTMHRAENVDNSIRLQNIIDALMELEDVTVIFPAHPRTLKNLEKYELLEKMENAKHIQIIKPVGYLDFLLLLSKSKLIMTDSGGLQEEAITLNIPCVTLRYNTERPETVTAGGNVLLGADKDVIVKNVNEILNNSEIYAKMSNAKNPYGDGDSSKKILNSIIKLHDENKLKTVVPKDIMKTRSRTLIEINENISVFEFEKKNEGTTVKMAFENGKVLYPHGNLKLKGMFVLVELLNDN